MTDCKWICAAVIIVLAVVLWQCSKKKECAVCDNKQKFSVTSVENPMALNVENDIKISDSLMSYAPVREAQFRAGDSLMGLGVPLGANETINSNSENHYGNFNSQFQPMNAAYGNNSRSSMPTFSRQKTGLIGIW